MLILAFFSSTLLMSIGLWGFIMSSKYISLMPTFGGLAFFLLAVFALIKKQQRGKILGLIMIINIIIFSMALIGLFKTLSLSDEMKSQELVVSQILIALWSFLYFLASTNLYIKKRKKAV